jgi:ABC-2 type transport system permease protein
MSVTTAAPPAVIRGSALARLTVSELKLLMRERIRLFFGVGFPLILLIIFGSIPPSTGRARPSAATPRWTSISPS